MGYESIENDIKSGAIDKAAPILLYGEEHFLVDFYEKKLSALFSGKLDENGDVSGANEGNVPNLDLCVLYGNESEDDEIIGALDTYPMFSPLRVVVVRGHSGFSGSSGSGQAGSGKSSKSDAEGDGFKQSKKKDTLSDNISQMPDTSRLIFTADKINKTRALYKAIAKSGTVYEFTRLDENSLLKFVKKRFRKMNVQIEQEVLDAFVFANGYLEKNSDVDLYSVENDVYKVSSFALSEGQTSITLPIVEECMPSILRTDVFAMLDALSTGKKSIAISLLENSMASGENVFRLLSLLTGQFEIMLGYKELSAQGHSSSEITKILGERSDWRVKKLGGYAGRFDVENLQKILLKLYETEANIKSGNISERLALTVLIAEI